MSNSVHNNSRERLPGSIYNRNKNLQTSTKERPFFNGKINLIHIINIEGGIYMTR